MAPKQPEVIENPPVGSSSDEEEEESGSTGGESESSGEEEDSKKDDDSSDEDEAAVKPTQAPVASKKVAEAESESESESDSDPEPTKKKSQNTIPISALKSSVVPESSNSKRSMKQSEDQAKKKMKTTNEEEAKKKVVSGDETKQMFQRIFSETDEINLLQGILDFTSTRAWEIDGFCDYVKELINFNANRSQLVTKIQRLKKRFANTVKNALKKGKSEEEIVFSKDLDEKIFDLSRKIWGNNGVLESKFRRKLEGKPIEFKLKPHLTPKKKEVTNKPLAIANAVTVVSVPFGGSEISSFFKQENVSAVGLDEYAIVAGWSMVPEGPKKREMEEKLKKLKTIQAGLCLKRTGLVADSAKLLFKDHASSSGM